MRLLEAINLDVSIAGIRVCRDLQLAVACGECWGLLGCNGAGKSTLLHTLAGLRSPDAGEILVGGKPLRRMRRRDLARWLGLLLQDDDAWFPARVHDVVLSGRHPHIAPWAWESEFDHRIAAESLAQVGLESFGSRQITSLSGGERRRVAIAALLAQAPRLLLLDEPTSHLDLHQQFKLLQRLTELKQQGRGLLISLHDVNLALRFCDHLLLLADGDYRVGRTVELGTERELTRIYKQALQSLAGPAGPVMVPI
jgi:iron complex transport system ATP-binding protein